MELGKKWETDEAAGNVYAPGEEFHKGNSGAVRRQVVAGGGGRCRFMWGRWERASWRHVEVREGAPVNTWRRPVCTGNGRCELGQNSACLQKSTEVNVAGAEWGKGWGDREGSWRVSLATTMALASPQRESVSHSGSSVFAPKPSPFLWNSHLSSSFPLALLSPWLPSPPQQTTVMFPGKFPSPASYPQPTGTWGPRHPSAPIRSPMPQWSYVIDSACPSWSNWCQDGRHAALTSHCFWSRAPSLPLKSNVSVAPEPHKQCLCLSCSLPWTAFPLPPRVSNFISSVLSAILQLHEAFLHSPLWWDVLNPWTLPVLSYKSQSSWLVSC